MKPTQQSDGRGNRSVESIDREDNTRTNDYSASQQGKQQFVANDNMHANNGKPGRGPEEVPNQDDTPERIPEEDRATKETQGLTKAGGERR